MLTLEVKDLEKSITENTIIHGIVKEGKGYYEVIQQHATLGMHRVKCSAEFYIMKRTRQRNNEHRSFKEQK